MNGNDGLPSWRDGGRLGLLVRALVDRFRSSLFGVPLLWLVGALTLSQIATRADRAVEPEQLPAFLDTTVDSARALLGAVSSGTIAAASVVFSLTLVAVQLSASVYSSRVLRSFLRDRFQQHMIGLVTATFFYSLLVLREVRGPLEDDGTPYIPRISVFIAVVLALAAVMALLASISHTAQSLRVSSITRRIGNEVMTLIESRLGAVEEGDPEPSTASRVDVQGAGAAPSSPHDPGGAGPAAAPPNEMGSVLLARKSGWLQQVSIEALREGLPSGTALRLEVAIGAYAIEGTPLLTMWPSPEGAHAEEAFDRMHDAFGLGVERSLHEDVAYGIEMMEDIAVKALSPGVNDPNTAKAVIVQLGELVLAILSRPLAPGWMEIDGCEISRPREPTYQDYVMAAFGQIWVYAADQPAVQRVLVDTLVDVGDELIRRRRRDPEPLAALRTLLHHIRAGLDDGRPSVGPSADVHPELARTLHRLDHLDWDDRSPTS